MSAWLKSVRGSAGDESAWLKSVARAPRSDGEEFGRPSRAWLRTRHERPVGSGDDVALDLRARIRDCAGEREADESRHTRLRSVVGVLVQELDPVWCAVERIEIHGISVDDPVTFVGVDGLEIHELAASSVAIKFSTSVPSGMEFCRVLAVCRRNTDVVVRPVAPLFSIERRGGGEHKGGQRDGEHGVGGYPYLYVRCFTEVSPLLV